MNIALIAHDRKKELWVQFCMAYCGILAKHNICATGTTGKSSRRRPASRSTKCLAGMQGGEEQISARVAYNEIDLCCFSEIRCPTRSTSRTFTPSRVCAICTTFRSRPTRQRLKCSSSVLTAAIWIGEILSTRRTESNNNRTLHRMGKIPVRCIPSVLRRIETWKK